MKKRRIIGSLAALALLVSLIVTAEAGTTFSALIVQGNTAILSVDSVAVPCAVGESVEHTEMVYVPVSATTYRLCHAVTFSGNSTYYVDAVTGENVDLFVE